MIAVDTNILVYAHRTDSPWHEVAYRCLQGVADSRWAIAWPCIHEFLAVVTHPRIFDPPTPLVEAQVTVSLWVAAPSLSLLSEIDGYWELLSELIKSSQVVGPRIHDARIAALCIQHSVDELWTVDRDFSRFSALRTRNPLLSI
jgi:toxin-antitoxin system PIN domain toxin